MSSIVLDVDDTLIDTTRRMQAVWRELLGLEVPLKAVETLALEQIFMKYASSEQKTQMREFQRRFWDIVLCLENVGIDSLKLHRAIPFAAHILQGWNAEYKLVYLTGRTENMRKHTLTELGRFGFPVDGVELLMFKVEDYERARGVNPSGPTLIEAKSKLFSLTSREYDVLRVVDDFPGYFSIYKQFDVPDRIGLLRPIRYKPHQYIEHGATRVIRSWKELQDDLPQSQ